MRSKSLSLLLGVVLLCAVPLTAEDTLQEVLNKHYEAIGGIEAWKAVENCRLNGRMELMPGMGAPFTMIYARPFKTRIEVMLEGMTRIQVFDGETAWAAVPLADSLGPQVMPEEHTALMREQSDFDGPLMDWEAKGHQVSLVGKETIGSGEAFHLKVVLDTGSVRHLFIDSEDYLLVRLEAEIPESDVEVETIFDDYRKVGALMMAHSIESRPIGSNEGQVLVIEAIEFNVELDDDLFVMPTGTSDESAEGEAAE